MGNAQQESLILQPHLTDTYAKATPQTKIEPLPGRKGQQTNLGESRRMAFRRKRAPPGPSGTTSPGRRKKDTGRHPRADAISPFLSIQARQGPQAGRSDRHRHRLPFPDCLVVNTPLIIFPGKNVGPPGNRRASKRLLAMIVCRSYGRNRTAVGGLANLCLAPRPRNSC
jgi:hypothetical protein